MRRRTPRSTRTDTRVPYTTLCRSLDALDGEIAVLDRLFGGHRLPLGADRQPVDLVAVPAHQSRVEPLPVGFQMRGDRPIFLGIATLDLAPAQIGRASGRGRVEKYGKIQVVSVSKKKTNSKKTK